jgi:Fe-S cluster biosynthesis and repair protein YggX
MITCMRCGREGDPPSPARVAFLGPLKQAALQGICRDCWAEWEALEVKVINEYRLNFMDPEHRAMLRRACSDFLGLESQAAARPPDLPLLPRE